VLIRESRRNKELKNSSGGNLSGRKTSAELKKRGQMGEPEARGAPKNVDPSGQKGKSILGGKFQENQKKTKKTGPARGGGSCRKAGIFERYRKKKRVLRGTLKGRGGRVNRIQLGEIFGKGSLYRERGWEPKGKSQENIRHG